MNLAGNNNNGGGGRTDCLAAMAGVAVEQASNGRQNVITAGAGANNAGAIGEGELKYRLNDIFQNVFENPLRRSVNLLAAQSIEAQQSRNNLTSMQRQELSLAQRAEAEANNNMLANNSSECEVGWAVFYYLTHYKILCLDHQATMSATGDDDI